MRRFAGSLLLASLLSSCSLPCVKKSPQDLIPIQVHQSYHGPKTVAHFELDAEETFASKPAHFETLENILVKSRQVLPKLTINNCQSATNILTSIHQLLINEGFRRTGNIDVFSHALASKKADCDIYTSLYMSIAQANGLPLKAVINWPCGYKDMDGNSIPVPGHAFIRWKFSPTNHITWECVYGIGKEDRHMLADLKPARPLTEEELILNYPPNKQIQEMSFEQYTFWVMKHRLTFCSREMMHINITKRDIYEKALNWMKGKRTSEPNNIELLILEGDIYLGCEDYDSAISSYQYVIKYSSNILSLREAFLKRNYCLSILEQEANRKKLTISEED